MTQYVAVMEVHVQCSADYESVKSTATRIFGPSSTVQEVMDWVGQFKHCLGHGDVVLTEAQQP